MAGEDLEWLLHQFSSGGSSLPRLKSLGPNQDAAPVDAAPQRNFQRYQSFEDGIQEPFRDILSRSPYIFVANKRQEALLAEAATFEKPLNKFASGAQRVPLISTPNKESHLHNVPPVRHLLNRSPNHASSALRGAAAIAPRNGRSSAPPILEVSVTVDAERTVEKRGKNAVIQRLELLRNNDEALLLLQNNVERYLRRQKDGGRSGKLSPVHKNRRAAKTQTLENRISRLEEQRLVSCGACCARCCLGLLCCRLGSKRCRGCRNR
jgi:hypothetical protein